MNLFQWVATAFGIIAACILFFTAFVLFIAAVEVERKNDPDAPILPKAWQHFCNSGVAFGLALIVLFVFRAIVWALG